MCVEFVECGCGGMYSVRCDGTTSVGDLKGDATCVKVKNEMNTCKLTSA